MSLLRQNTLAQQTSQVFEMTLNELQNSFPGSEKIASMNLEEFIAAFVDQHKGSANESEAANPPVCTANAPSMNTISADYRGKPVEEVWQAIQAAKEQSGETITIGNFLHTMGVDVPSSISVDLHNTNLSMPSDQSLQAGRTVSDEAEMPLIVPQPSAAPPASAGLYNGPLDPSKAAQKFQLENASRPKKTDSSYFGSEGEALLQPSQAQRKQRKRKDPDVVDERTARLQKRMVKNRESAARSRARKQEYTAQLEQQVAELKEQNDDLIQKLKADCAAAPRPVTASLRRMRTMPPPEIRGMLEESPSSFPEHSQYGHADLVV